MADQLGEAFVSIRATLDKLDQDLTASRKKVEGATGAPKPIDIGISTAVANKSIELLQDGMRLAVDTMADGISMATDLEAQLDTIGAISGATEEQVAGLKDTIMDLGIDPNLKVSAFEAAQAVEELAAGGVALEDIMNGAARGTVALANASGADFALAATVAADSMAIFGIEAKDLEQVVDGVAAVAVQSKFDVEDYALALAQAGGVAASVGVEFDDFNTTIAGIAPLFASGSDAGTSFKTMLQRLIPASNPAEDAMQELGLLFVDTTEAMQFLTDKGFAPIDNSLESVTESFKKFGKETDLSKSELQTLMDSMISQQNVFFDAQGNMKGMADIAGSMQAAFAGLSEEQRTQALSTIFGTDAMRAAVGLMELGGQGFTDLQNKMGQTSGMDAAAERMENLKGVTEILDGVVEGLQLQYGDKLIPKLTEMAQKATAFASTEGPALVDSLADLTLGAIDFGDRATPALGKALGVIVDLGTSTNNLVTAGVNLAEAWGLASEKAENIDAVMLILNATVDAALAPYNGLKAVIDTLTAAFTGWGQTVRDVKDWFSDLGGSLSGLDSALPEWLRPGSPTPLEIGLRGIGDALRNMPKFDIGQFSSSTSPLSNWTIGDDSLQGFIAMVNRDTPGALQDFEDLVNAGASFGEASKGWASESLDLLRQYYNQLSSPVSLPSVLTPGSPTPFEMGIRGISQAIRDMPDLSSRFNAGALAGAGVGGGGSGSTTNIFIDGIQVGSGSGGSVDEALQEAFDILKTRIKGKK